MSRLIKLIFALMPLAFIACSEPDVESPSAACFSINKDTLIKTVVTKPSGEVDTLRELKSIEATNAILNQTVVFKDCALSDYGRLYVNASNQVDTIILLKHNAPEFLVPSPQGVVSFRYKSPGVKTLVYETWNVRWKNVDGKWKGTTSDIKKTTKTITVNSF